MPCGFPLSHSPVKKLIIWWRPTGAGKPKPVGMTTNPQEIEQHERQLDNFHGDVLVGGLGLGLAIALTAFLAQPRAKAEDSESLGPFLRMIYANSKHMFERISKLFEPTNKLFLSREDRDCVRLGVPQATEWQRIGNQIDAAMIFTRADFVNVHHLHHRNIAKDE
jgi:hypothetical protein